HRDARATPKASRRVVEVKEKNESATVGSAARTRCVPVLRPAQVAPMATGCNRTSHITVDRKIRSRKLGLMKNCGVNDILGLDEAGGCNSCNRDHHRRVVRCVLILLA